MLSIEKIIYKIDKNRSVNIIYSYIHYNYYNLSKNI